MKILSVIFGILFILTTILVILFNAVIIIKSIDDVVVASCVTTYINFLIIEGFIHGVKIVGWFDPIKNWKNKKEDKKYLPFEYNDGGRRNYFKNQGEDCAVRAISIATERNYLEVYKELSSLNLKYVNIDEFGTMKKACHEYLINNGWKWHKLKKEYKLQKDNHIIPIKGKVICQMSSHMTTVVNGVIQDTFLPHNYYFYGYYTKEA